MAPQGLEGFGARPSPQRYEHRDPGFTPDFPSVVALSGQVLRYQYVAWPEDTLRPVSYLDLHGPAQVKSANSAGGVVPRVGAFGVKSPVGFS